MCNSNAHEWKEENFIEILEKYPLKIFLMKYNFTLKKSGAQKN